MERDAGAKAPIPESTLFDSLETVGGNLSPTLLTDLGVRRGMVAVYTIAYGVTASRIKSRVDNPNPKFSTWRYLPRT